MTKISNQYSLTNVLFADAVNGRVGIGTSSPTVALDVVGAGKFSGALGGTSATFSGNLNAAQISASANIYISSTAPTLIFTNGAQSTTFGLLQHDGTNLSLNNSINGVMTFATNNVEKMRILANGNIGIGINSPNGYVATTSGLIHLNSSNTFAEIHLTNTSTGTTSADGLSLTQYFDQTIIMNHDNNAMLFGTNALERMRITSGGLVAISTTSALINESSLAATSNGNTVTFKTTLNGGNPLLLWNTAAGAQSQITFFTGTSITAAGGITTNGTVTSYNVTSDYRLKEDFKQIKGIEKLTAIKVYDFKWKSNESRMDGVIAHELAEVIPCAVFGDKDGEKMQQVDYSKIVPVMIKAIQELSAQASEQQLQINELKALLNA